MSYRPDGWKKTANQLESLYYTGLKVRELIEMSADAMLEALKKEGAMMTPEQMKLLAPDRQYPFGWLVFIPDEKKK